MNDIEYEEFVLSKWKNDLAERVKSNTNAADVAAVGAVVDLTYDLDLAIAAMGLAGEAAEAMDIIKKVVAHGKPLDVTTMNMLILELGDVEYYMTIIRNLLNVSREAVLACNQVKLDSRYPTRGLSVRDGLEP